MDARFTGRPTLVILDEAWKVLHHPIWAPRIAEWLKGKAKKNVACVLAWQEIYDATHSALWQAIQASCQTEVYLPNGAALNAEVLPYYQACGLPLGHIQTLAHARPQMDYLYKTQHATRLFQLRLSPLERWLCAASRQEEIAALQVLQRQTPAQPLVVAWLRHGGFVEEAALYLAHYTTQKEVPCCAARTV